MLSLNHLERLRWCKEVSQINSQLNQDGEQPENIFEKI